MTCAENGRSDTQSENCKFENCSFSKLQNALITAASSMKHSLAKSPFNSGDLSDLSILMIFDYRFLNELDSTPKAIYLQTLSLLC